MQLFTGRRKGVGVSSLFGTLRYNYSRSRHAIPEVDGPDNNEAQALKYKSKCP